MKVTFGLSLDGPSYPELLGNRDACHGEVRVGPLGFLALLETHLGLGGVEATEPIRTAQYRTRLGRADDGFRFYSRSFEADAIGVARTLYHCREELIVAGWNGAASAEAPKRLRDFASVETVDEHLTLDRGPAERLRTVASQLVGRWVPIDELWLVEQVEDLAWLWRRVVELLGKNHVAVSRLPLPVGSAPGDLGRLQEVLAGSTERIAATGDGSLTLLTANSDLEAAEAVARWLSTRDGDTVVIDTSGDASLDEVIRRSGLAMAGISESSRFRPALQVLPLALALHWNPADPNRVLELLTLPVSPLPRFAAHRLAAALVESPGIGGEAWRNALGAIEEGIHKRVTANESGSGIEAKANQEVESIRERIRSWIQPERFGPLEGIPPAVVAATCGRVAQWLAGKLAASSFDDTVLGAALAAASEAMRLAEQESVSRLTPAQLHRLVDAATRSGAAHPGSIAEAGHLPTLRAPDAFLGTAPTVVWWDFTEASIASPPPSLWSSAEREALAREGVFLADAVADRLRRTQCQLRPILAATRRLLIVSPERRRGQPVTVHPLWDRIASAFGDSVCKLKVHVADWLSRGLQEGVGDIASVRIPRRPLPRPKRWWALTSGDVLTPRNRESFTSLNDFLNHPFKWVLKYKAGLYAGLAAGLADGNLLLGNLAHRLIGEVMNEPSFAGADEDAVRALLEARIDAMLAEDGAVLLLPGRGPDRRRLLDRSVRAAKILLDTIRLGGWTLLGMEHSLPGAFVGGELEGRLDVALAGDGGRRAVVDIKWGGRKYRIADLANNTTLQLALYGHLLKRETGPWPASAFLVVDPPSLLSADDGAFPGAFYPTAAAGTPADLWASIGATWRWRREQLDRGLIEMTDGTERDANSQPTDGGRLTEEECKFNDYRSLIGFPREEQP